MTGEPQEQTGDERWTALVSEVHAVAIHTGCSRSVEPIHRPELPDEIYGVPQRLPGVALLLQPYLSRKDIKMNLFRQGDVLLIPVDKIPKSAKRAKPDNGRWVLAYGEVTGHHHSVAVEDGVELVTAEEADELRMWLSVTTDEPVALTHQEHATIMLPPGQYERRIQREYTPEAVWNVAD